MSPRPPTSTRPDTLFPYPTLFRSPRRKGTMVRSCTCLCLGRPSLAGVLGAVRGTAIPDYGDAVPGTGTVGLPESTTGTDRRPPRERGRAACPPAVGCCHGVQGRSSEERRVGNGCVSKCRYRWSPDHKKKHKK